jgi:hypothetical protein
MRIVFPRIYQWQRPASHAGSIRKSAWRVITFVRDTRTSHHLHIFAASYVSVAASLRARADYDTRDRVMGGAAVEA